jgi:hypothetical protein
MEAKENPTTYNVQYVFHHTDILPSQDTSGYASATLYSRVHGKR